MLSRHDAEKGLELQLDQKLKQTDGETMKGKGGQSLCEGCHLGIYTVAQLSCEKSQLLRPSPSFGTRSPGRKASNQSKREARAEQLLRGHTQQGARHGQAPPMSLGPI
jgi:hypothetical protein